MKLADALPHRRVVYRARGGYAPEAGSIVRISSDPASVFVLYDRGGTIALTRLEDLEVGEMIMSDNQHETRPGAPRGEVMNIAGLDRARVLRALWNASDGSERALRAAGIAPVGRSMTVEQAQALLFVQRNRTDANRSDRFGVYFDYLSGRVLKTLIPFDDDELDLRLYDRDNGPGAGERAIRAEFSEIDWSQR